MSNLIPDGWGITTLQSNATLITDGSHFSPQTFELGKPIATVQNMRERHIDVSSCRLISPDKFDDLVKGNCLPEYGDVLFSKDGTIGKTFVYKQKQPIVLLSSIAIIRLKQHLLNPDYCTQYLQSSLFYKQLENATSGSAIRRVVLKDIKQLELPTPPLPEQQKIADILTSVDDVIEKTQAQIDKLKDLKTGMMQELLTRGVGVDGKPHTEFKDSPVGRIPKGWDCIHLETLLKDTKYPMRSGPFGSALLKHELVPKGSPYLGIDNVHIERFEKSYKRYVSDEKFEQLKRYSVYENDVMITIMGTVGRSCVVPKGIGRALSSKHVWTMTFDQEKYFSNLICWQLNYSTWVQKQFKNESQGGVMESISSKTLKQLWLPLPSIDEQNIISKAHINISNLIYAKERKLNETRSLKKALMQDLLTGKVRVKVDS